MTDTGLVSRWSLQVVSQMLVISLGAFLDVESTVRSHVHVSLLTGLNQVSASLDNEHP